MKKQKDIVLEHIQKFGSITAYDAAFQYGILRLSAVIHSLKSKGYQIVSQMVTSNTGSRFAKYWIEAM